MRGSITIASLFAALAIAKPLRHIHHKRALVTETDIVVETDYVTVTEGAGPAPTHSKAPVTTVIVENTVYASPAEPSSTAQAIKSPAVFAQKDPAPAKPQTTTAPAKPQTTAAPAVVSSQAAPSQPAPSSAAPSDNGLTPFQLAAVNAHNPHRNNHTAPPLTWNDTLATSAAANAQKCVFAHDSCGDAGCPFGQNINVFGQQPFPASIDLPSVVANSITEGWYNAELPTFNSYGVANPVTPGADEPWLHFTQVIWKGTGSVGCAVQHCQAGTANAYESVYTVCNYYPPGNFQGDFDKNVSPPNGDTTVDAKIVMS